MKKVACSLRGLAAALGVMALLALPAYAGPPKAAFDFDMAAADGKKQDRPQQLDALFAKLRDPAGSGEVERQIWTLWMQSDSAEEDKILASATMAMSAGDYRLSEELLNQLIARDKRFPEAWNKRATLYYLMGRLDESLADIVKTLDLEPRHFGALSGRGMILKQQGRMPEALAAYREANAINPHMPGVAAVIKELETQMPDL
jgi:tetratricopeptide (TPR) repeat protein